MGKVDDMRRQREAQHEQGQRAAAARAAAPTPVDIEIAGAAARPAAVVTTPPEYVDPVEGALVPSQATWKPSPKTPARPAGAKGTATDETGTCSGCGKPKPIQRGVIASHQKGLGKMCPGSRKPPT